MPIRWLEPDAPDADVATVCRSWNRHDSEVGVESPPVTVDEVRARLARGWDGEPERIGAWVDHRGEVTAVVTSFTPTREDRDVAIIGCLAGASPAAVPVLAAGLAALVEEVVAAGRTHVLAEAWDFLPEHGAVLDGLGFAPVHRQLLYEKSPVGPAAPRDVAGGVVIEHHSGPSPDERLAALGSVADAIEDAPTGEVAFDPVAHTLERLRAWEAGQLLRGQRIHRTVARDLATGRLVGHSVVTVGTAYDSLAVQHDTAVLASHRNAGIGEALKVAMLAALTATEPQVTTVQTWNAADNAPIRALNLRLGFAELAAATGWERRVTRP